MGIGASPRRRSARRRVVPVGLFIATGLLGLSHPAITGATCFRVSASDKPVCFTAPTYRYMILNIALQGTFTYTQTTSGQDQNASCGNASGTTPNSTHRSLDATFDVVWYHVKVPFGPIKGRRSVTLTDSGKATVSGTYFLSGSFYNANCMPVKYPGSGSSQSCQGELTAAFKKQGLLIVNYPLNDSQPDRNHLVIDMDPLALPFGEKATPPGCMDNDSPPNEHNFDTVFGGGLGLSPRVDVEPDVNPKGDGIGTSSFSHSKTFLRIPLPMGFKSDCSVPAQSEQCHQNYRGSADVYIYRVGVIK